MEDTDITACFFALTVLLHFFFAIGVFVAARRLRSHGEKLMFAPPIIWAIHTLLWGMCAMLPYWLIHHSSLRLPKQNARAVG